MMIEVNYTFLAAILIKNVALKFSMYLNEISETSSE
jgi:hypothetical protein